MAKIRARPETGTLYFDFFFRGKRCREQTTLEDIPANRKRLQKVLNTIEAEIKLGTFDYAKFFPGSKNIAKFATGLPVMPIPIAASVAQAVSGTPASAANNTVRARASSGLVLPKPLKSEISSPSRPMRTCARIKNTPSVMIR